MPGIAPLVVDPGADDAIRGEEVWEVSIGGIFYPPIAGIVYDDRLTVVQGVILRHSSNFVHEILELGRFFNFFGFWEGSFRRRLDEEQKVAC